MENLGAAVGFMFIWLVVLTVAFVIHWIKVERSMKFDTHMGSKVSDGLRSKVLGEN